MDRWLKSIYRRWLTRFRYKKGMVVHNIYVFANKTSKAVLIKNTGEIWDRWDEDEQCRYSDQYVWLAKDELGNTVRISVGYHWIR